MEKVTFEITEPRLVTKGEDGVTPHIGENGNWFIGEEDTGISASGIPGARGKKGKDGKDGKDFEPEVIEDTGSSSKTLIPEPGVYYKFGTLVSLTLQSVPDSVQPIVIWFASGGTKTTISFPQDVLVAGKCDDINTSYELSIINKRAVFVKF